MKTFTNDDLVRFVYYETSNEENILICQAMLEDNILAKTCQEMLDVKNEMDREFINPSDSSVNIILNYSRLNSRSKSLL